MLSSAAVGKCHKKIMFKGRLTLLGVRAVTLFVFVLIGGCLAALAKRRRVIYIIDVNYMFLPHVATNPRVLPNSLNNKLRKYMLIRLRNHGP